MGAHGLFFNVNTLLPAPSQEGLKARASVGAKCGVVAFISNGFLSFETFYFALFAQHMMKAIQK